MTKPRILRITTVPISLKLLLTGQMKFMKENGFEVLMVSADGKEIQEIIRNEGCEHTVIPFTRQITIFQDLICLFHLIKLIRRFKPDVIHTHTPKAGLLGMLAGKICNTKIKIHTIAGLPLMTAYGFKRKLLIFVEKLTYWSADVILPNSNSIMQFVKENNLTKESKLDMIGKGSSNGISLNRFSVKNVKDQDFIDSKKSINYNPENKYILSVGRVVKDKGVIELVDAFIEIQKKIDNLVLVIVGPLEKERASELLPKHTLEAIENNSNIFHINWSNQVEQYMHLADILVHASFREGFPNVPLQAGAMECPIICSSIPGNIDIVTDKKTGLYFQPGSTNELIKCLNFALEHKTIMREYSKTLRHEIERKFSRKYIHQELLDFYTKKTNLKKSNHT